MSIENKIKNLLRKSEAGGTTPAEAETCLNLAFNLAKKHRLDYQSLANGVEEDDMEVGITTFILPYKSIPKPVTILFAKICDLKRCLYWIQTDRSSSKIRTAKIVGTKSDRIVAKYLFDTLVKIMNRGAKDFSNGCRSKYNGWRIGFAVQIANKIDDLIKSALEYEEISDSSGSDSRSSDLILANEYRTYQEKYSKYLPPNLKREKMTPQTSSIEASRAGATAADRTALSSQVETEESEIRRLG